MKRYDFKTEYNHVACEDQVIPVEDPKGHWVRHEDVAALIATVEASTKELLATKELAMRLAKQSGILAAASMQLKTFCKNLVSGNIPEFHKAEAIRIALSYEDDLIKQHLHDIRAEAGRDAIKALIAEESTTLVVAHSGCRGTDAGDLIDVSAITVQDAERFTDEYAASVRAGDK